jgi:hypothetical protein
VDGYGYRDSEGSGRIHIQLQIPANVGTCGLVGSVWLADNGDGYDLAVQALRQTGREPLEQVLTWVLDETATKLADAATAVEPQRRRHWTEIVEAGRGAREDHARRWGDGTEPAFQLIGATYIDS